MTKFKMSAVFFIETSSFLSQISITVKKQRQIQQNLKDRGKTIRDFCWSIFRSAFGELVFPDLLAPLSQSLR